MFGGSPFDFDNRPHNTHRRKCKDIHRQYNISLEEAYNGVEKNLNITITKHCHECLKICSNCKGTGVVKQIKSLGMFTQIFQGECDRCNSGYISSAQSSCQQCKGKSKYTHENNTKLDIPKGANTGFVKTFKDLGEQSKNSKEISGNLLFNIHVNEHSHFKRKGNDLYYQVNISFIESIIGKIIEIPFFNNEKIIININTFGVVHPGKHYMIQNKGMPILNTSSFGNMFVEFMIKYPKQKNNEKLKELENLLNEVF